MQVEKDTNGTRKTVLYAGKKENLKPLIVNNVIKNMIQNLIIKNFVLMLVSQSGEEIKK